MHLGSLKSTQEARVALGCTSSNSYASFVLSKLPRASMTRYTHAKHEPILKSLGNKLTCFSWQKCTSWIRVDKRLSSGFLACGKVQVTSERVSKHFWQEYFHLTIKNFSYSFSGKTMNFSKFSAPTIAFLAF